MAGDISPIDVLSHVPVMCEDASIPYVFVPSKVELGKAASTRRPTCCVMVSTPKSAESDVRKYFDKCVKELKSLM
jgi:H/ACA ribonucleoprotein complex subunit 2